MMFASRKRGLLALFAVFALALGFTGFTGAPLCSAAARDGDRAPLLAPSTAVLTRDDRWLPGTPLSTPVGEPTSDAIEPPAEARQPAPERSYDVCVIEATGVPANFEMSWLLLPPEPFLPGIVIADHSLFVALEQTGARLRILGEFVESDDYYLVQASPFVSEGTLSGLGKVLWSDGSSYLVSVRGESGRVAAFPGIHARQLRPAELRLSSVPAFARLTDGYQFRPPVLRVSYSESERFWIELMVDSVSQSDISDFLDELTGEVGVDVGYGLDTIRTRYSYHPSCTTAAKYIYDKFEDMGLDVEYEHYFGVPLRTVAFSGYHGYAASGNGIIYHTEDGGDTWERQDVGTNLYLWKACAIAADTAWIAGGLGMLIGTVDGGASWPVVPTGTTYFLYGVKFVNSQVGWVAGDAGHIRRTTDGGLNWSPQSSSTMERLYDIEFVDVRKGWAVGNSGKVVHTSDGGENWSGQTSNTTARLYDVCFVDSLHGWAVGTSGTIIHTADGGATWETQATGLTSSLMGVSFVDSLRGWTAGSAGIVLFTNDAGEHWTQQETGTYNALYGLQCIDSLHGWAVGISAVIRTEDGTTWPSISGNMPDQWRNVVGTLTGVTNPSHQYIVCGHFDSTSDDPMVLAPGADDNGTGTSLVLEAASVLRRYPLHSTIKFICFSGEEQGLMGSNHYAGHARQRNDDIRGVLNFDMVGYGTPSAYLIANSESEWLVDYCVAVRDSFLPSLPLTKVVNPAIRYSDHAPFWDRGYSALCGIEVDYVSNPYYHQTTDVVGNLTLSFTADVTRLAVASLAALAGVDTANVHVPERVPAVAGLRLGMNFPNPFNPYTTIPFAIPSTSTPTNYVLAILDPAGRMVRILERGRTGASPLEKKAVWDGTDEDGRPVSSGVYLSYLGCGGEHTARKIVLTR